MCAASHSQSDSLIQLGTPAYKRVNSSAPPSLARAYSGVRPPASPALKDARLSRIFRREPLSCDPRAIPHGD